jgi:hypothetical protein
MKRIFASLTIIIGVFAVSTSLSAKGETTRIIISGVSLATPIEITDAAIVRPFQVWAGAGTMTCIRGACYDHTKGFIVDWVAGNVAERPSGLQRYIVSFYTTFDNAVVNADGETLAERPSYIVWYEYDPATQKGFVYLPGKGDQGYETNSHTFIRGFGGPPEGNWFHASNEWDDVAASLLPKPTR